MKILVIENTEKHIADAKTFFSTINDIEFVYATSLCEAISLDGTEYEPISDGRAEKATMSERLLQYDGIITDIHFPVYNGKGKGSGVDAQIGVAIIIAALNAGIPCVGISDTYHHSDSMEWITIFLRMSYPKDVLFDSIDFNTKDQKPWQIAWEELAKQLAVKENRQA